MIKKRIAKLEKKLIGSKWLPVLILESEEDIEDYSHLTWKRYGNYY
ncbi:hypothetical protein [Fictibacillus phosphorivorans]|nr:hypothetical protein [Fictibacillus phosphorivorans]